MRENAMNSSVSKGKSILKLVLKSAVIVSERQVNMNSFTTVFPIIT